MGMIFKHTHGLILSAGKCQTRRPVKDGEILYTNIRGVGLLVRKNSRTLYRVNMDYPVQPGQTLPAVLYNPADLTQGGAVWNKERVAYVDRMGNAYSMPVLMELGWRPLRIKIMAIRQEPLQSISWTDAQAEGAPPDEFCDCYSPVMWYMNTWEKIKRPPAQRWDANPLVWVYTFEIA